MSDPLQFTYESTPNAWRCYYDAEGPQGFGKTKDEALFDLWLSCDGEEEPLMKAIVAAVPDDARVVGMQAALAIIEQIIDAVPDQGNDFENGRLSGLYSAKHALEDAAADSASNGQIPPNDPDRVKLLDFFAKHALGPLAKPSCLVCGRGDYEWPPAIQHMELPGVVVCDSCRDRAGSVPVVDVPADTVPRSRYDACNADWLAEKARGERLEIENRNLRATLEWSRERIYPFVLREAGPKPVALERLVTLLIAAYQAADRQPKMDEQRDAARYRAIRGLITHILEDEAGIQGVAYSYQLPIAMTESATEEELLDAVADAAVEIDAQEPARGRDAP